MSLLNCTSKLVCSRIISVSKGLDWYFTLAFLLCRTYVIGQVYLFIACLLLLMIIMVEVSHSFICMRYYYSIWMRIIYTWRSGKIYIFCIHYMHPLRSQSSWAFGLTYNTLITMVFIHWTVYSSVYIYFF